jgi:hypothetical protein
LSAVSVPVEDEPLTALVPDHPPEAAQAVAFVATQVSVDAAPCFTVLGVAEKLTVGAGALTDTVADCAALPAAPVQVSLKVELARSAPVDCDPFKAFLPDHAPDAVHEVAFSDDQVKVELAPVTMLLGLAERATEAVGLALTVTVTDCAALPPAPLHDRA